MYVCMYVCMYAFCKENLQEEDNLSTKGQKQIPKSILSSEVPLYTK